MDKAINILTMGIGLFNIIAIFLVITVHSFTKSAVSLALLDRQPKDAGRLSLNPIKHFEWIGFLLMFFTMGMGWDKPIRTSTLFYKNKKTGALLVHGLPIIACIVLAVISAIVKNHALVAFANGNNLLLIYMLRQLMDTITIVSINFAVFNLIPIYPMDGSAILRAYLSPNQSLSYTRLEGVLQMILVFALMFGLLGGILSPIVNLLYALINII